jgi:hypothetical protein
MLHEPPVIPFYIRELLGPLASSKRRITTKDGRLTCSCGNPTGCTCKPTTDAPHIGRDNERDRIFAIEPLKRRLDTRQLACLKTVAASKPGICSAKLPAGAGGPFLAIWRAVDNFSGPGVRPRPCGSVDNAGRASVGATAAGPIACALNAPGFGWGR